MIRHNSYAFLYYKYFDFSKFSHIGIIRRGGQKHGEAYNNVIIMADTETSKEIAGTVCKNYVVAWTLSVRAYGMNLCTLYGSRPSEFIECVNRMVTAMPGEFTVVYIHNLPYDWVFLRKFMFAAWGTPLHQLNVKSHYPISIEFQNGIILKDSLILSQRSLDKWAKDMDVVHKKASGFWDYDKVRNQGERFTPHEKTYIEHDTLAGVECIQKTMDTLGKSICSLPLTATGIPREICIKLAKENDGRNDFLRMVNDYDTQLILEKVFHGGYTHNNRHHLEHVIYAILKDAGMDPKDTKSWMDLIEAFDEASAYPFAMLTTKMPMEKFTPMHPCSIDYILKNADEYAYIFKLILIKPRLKSDRIPMPALQKSKATKMVNCIEDNGRVLCAEYFEIYLNEIDLSVIAEQYDYDQALCIDVHYAMKDYLPRWFTDFIFQCFIDKTKLKGGDPVQYSIAKAKLNALYGMCVQRPVKVMLEEDYRSGEFSVNEETDEKELYEKYVNNHRSVLNYAWGVWVTSAAFKNLFTIGSFAGTWLYSDTDSCYGQNWDKEGLAAYNEHCKQLLRDRGYGAVLHNGREYWLGICELDGTYTEFISVGAKRYATRDINGKLKITVAGVPKAGVNCLQGDLHNFHAGFIFDGVTTGKKQHTYFFEDDITTDAAGNERADSIDLSPANYLLDSVTKVDWEKVFTEEIEVQVYEEKANY